MFMLLLELEYCAPLEIQEDVYQRTTLALRHEPNLIRPTRIRSFFNLTT